MRIMSNNRIHPSHFHAWKLSRMKQGCVLLHVVHLIQQLRKVSTVSDIDQLLCICRYIRGKGRLQQGILLWLAYLLHRQIEVKDCTRTDRSRRMEVVSALDAPLQDMNAFLFIIEDMAGSSPNAWQLP